MTRGCFFLSDAHLRPLSTPGERARQRQLISFLKHLHGRAERLFVVGDLFDFWFDYRSVVPRRGGRVLAALADLADDGIPVTCFGGNHDWWIGPSLTEEYGIIVRHEPLWLETQGRRLYIAHGDGASVPSRRYTLLLRVLHHPLAIAAFRMVHPDWGVSVARFLGNDFRRKGEEETPALQCAPVYERIAEEVFASGADIAVFGHDHVARIKVTDAGMLVVLGEWISLGTYGELRDGVFRLRTWRSPDAEPWP